MVYVGNSLKALGNTIILKHTQDYISVYAHADKIFPTAGDMIKKGESIATIGKTGKVKTPQLHFQIRKKGRPQNPKKVVPIGG